MTQHRTLAPANASRAPRPAPARRGRSLRRRGVVIIIALLSVIVIAALFGYVMNVGRMTNRRIVAQNAADASARAGAAWMARQFNTVAMNNVSMSRLIALVPNLDAIPMASQFAYEDQFAFLTAVNNQLGNVPNWFLEESLRKIRDELQAEVDILEPMHEFFNEGGYDMTAMTHYQNGSGYIWQALTTLDHYNQATMTSLTSLTQINAVEGGLVNLEDDRGEVVMVVGPQVPWERGEFDHFRRPVKNGLLHEDIDHKEFNRGPWDVVFGWRHLIGGQTHGYRIPGTEVTVVSRGGRGSVPIGRGAGGSRSVGGRYVVTSREPDRYGVHGEFRRMTDRTSRFSNDHLPHSRFSTYANRMANFKLNYLGGRWTRGQFGIALSRHRDPKWIIDFAAAAAIADDPGQRDRIKETAFIGSELKSKYPPGHPSFLSPGTYAISTRRQSTGNPFLVRTNGWLDPRPWEDFPSVTRIADYIWRDVWSYEVLLDREIGVEAVYDAGGNRIPQEVWRVDDFVFLGVDVGEEVEVPNPFEGLDPNSAEAPSPVDFDHDLVTRDDEARFRYLSELAVVRRSDAALLWTSRFTGDKPDAAGSGGGDGSIVAVAQAHVFNNHSWDLWTQMWQSQLQRIDPQRYGDWLVRIDDLGGAETLGSSDHQRVIEYLNAVEPMAEQMIKH